MKHSLLFLLFLIIGITSVNAQILYQQDFESGQADDWMVISNASDGGWLIGSNESLSSNAFAIPSNDSNFVAATNDDDCNCDKGDEYFISPAIDLSGPTAAILTFDAAYLDNEYQGSQEDAKVEISTDGENFETILDIEGEIGWNTYSVNLDAYLGEESVYISFKYDDGEGWLYGFAIDNIIVDVPLTLDAGLLKLSLPICDETNKVIPIKGELRNEGITPITELEIAYTTNSNTPMTEVIDNIEIPAFEKYEFQLLTEWIPEISGIYTVSIEVVSINGEEDENDTNNIASEDIEIVDAVIIPNKINDFINSEPILNEITGAAEWLDKPTDLDFFPVLGKDELWVINQRTEDEGGSTVRIADITSETPSDFLHQIDENSWHFMSLPTAIAFSSDNYNFANSPGVKDANHDGGTFTGPSLWDSHPDVYAQPSGGNGSHIDMLHGSPYSMGIAHEVDNVFWIYDDWHEEIVRYDFVKDHGPGADDHSDGLVRRYPNIGLDTDGDIPNHMILDKETGWLYFVDNGNDRVVRLDINSGSVAEELPELNEPLAEHSEMGDFVVEVVIEEGLDRPCGIELFHNYLLVGDYANGDINIYDIDNGFEQAGKIATEEAGLTGIKIGPDGNIWYTNRIENKLMNAQPGEIQLPTNINAINSELKMELFPNPSNNYVNISVENQEDNSTIEFNITNVAGQSIMSFSEHAFPVKVDLSNIPSGVYYLNTNGETKNFINKLIIQH